jgi:hypothetical protein
MNSDSGGERDSEEYNNPTERQDEQTASHQDEGTDFKCFFETVFLIVRKSYFFMRSKQKLTSQTIRISGAFVCYVQLLPCAQKIFFLSLFFIFFIVL